LPRYLDLGYYRDKEGTPFTHSSNLVASLRQALTDLNAEKRFAAISALNRKLREQLAEAGLALLGTSGHSSPAVISIALPEHLSSLRIGEAMERRGWLLSYLSGYLHERNIIQICLMGSFTEEQCEQMMKAFSEIAATAT
jgi:aspartate aminotransferase-like enzyme